MILVMTTSSPLFAPVRTLALIDLSFMPVTTMRVPLHTPSVILRTAMMGVPIFSLMVC